MKKNRLRFFSALMCVLMLCMLLSGCGRSARLSPRSPVTLNMWHNYGGDMQQSMDLLIDEFNATVGREKGIVINVTAISSSSDLNESLMMIANGDPGAPDMPDIFTGYPKIAAHFQEKDMLLALDGYFTDAEQSAYVEAFLQEGRLADGSLYVFPIAKSTEVLYLNQTLFDEFARETGADAGSLASFEGLCRLAQQYYDWSGGKDFFAADAWFNIASAGMAQLGGDLFDESGTLDLENEAYRRIFETFLAPAAEGGIALYDGYSSDLSKTGDILCSTGSSAGILFYGDTITHADGTQQQVEYSILPYPVFEGGEKWALQRGGGLMVSKSTEKKALAAVEFIKWFTAPEQNMRFVSQTGYLPVTRHAFENELPAYLENIGDARIRQMLSAVLSMYGEYSFFTAPNLSNLDEESARYEQDYLNLLQKCRDAHLSGEAADADAAYREFIDRS